MFAMAQTRRIVYTSVIGWSCVTALSPLIASFYLTSPTWLVLFFFALSIAAIGILSGLGLDRDYYHATFVANQSLPSGNEQVDDRISRMINHCVVRGRLVDFVRLSMIYLAGLAVMMSIFHVPMITAFVGQHFFTGIALSQVSWSQSLAMVQVAMSLFSLVSLSLIHMLEQVTSEKIPLELSEVKSEALNNDLSARYTSLVSTSRQYESDNARLTEEINGTKSMLSSLRHSLSQERAGKEAVETQLTQMAKRHQVYAQIIDIRDDTSIDPKQQLALKGEVDSAMKAIFQSISAHFKTAVEEQVKHNRRQAKGINLFAGFQSSEEAVGKDIQSQIQIALTEFSRAYIGYQTNVNRSENPVSVSLERVFNELINKAVWDIIGDSGGHRVGRQVSLQRLQDETARILSDSGTDVSVLKGHLQAVSSCINQTLLLGDSATQRVRRDFMDQGVLHDGSNAHGASRTY
ncbi:MAG: hypothetical protein CMF46_02305 [Legionellales bacterium]|nr:hypothetical protein [Legionellales bacterium]